MNPDKKAKQLTVKINKNRILIEGDITNKYLIASALKELVIEKIIDGKTIKFIIN